MNSRNVERPPVPVRVPLSNHAISAALRLLHEGECYDRGVLERVAAGLRDLDVLRQEPGYSTQYEIDGVIARWRAAHQKRREDRS